jgi:hypothetical protein
MYRISEDFKLQVKSSVLWDITLCSRKSTDVSENCHLHLQGWRALLANCFMLFSCLAYSSALKREATYLSELSVGFEGTTQHYTPEDRHFHNHRFENLKSSNEIALTTMKGDYTDDRLNNGNTKRLRNRIYLCWLHWKNFSWQHWMLFFRLFTFCSDRASALLIVLNDSWCETIGKLETCPIMKENRSLVRV